MSEFAARTAGCLSRGAAAVKAQPIILMTGLVMALLLQPAHRLESQSTAEYQVRVDSLRVEWERKRDAFIELARELGPARIDTIRTGPFTVLVDEPLVELMSQAAPIAWDALRAELHSDSMLAAIKPVYFPSGGGSRTTERSEDVFPGPWISETANLDEVVDRVILTVGAELRLMLDEPSRLWLSANPLARVVAERRDWPGAASFRWIYVELATSGSAVGRRCFDGHLPACRSALELEPASDPATEWYDALDRRRLIVRGGVPRGLGTIEEWRSCTEAGDDIACETLFRARLEGSVTHPVSTVAHQALVETALQMGGVGAYGRLVLTEAPTIADWIAAVARAPADSVIEVWYSDVIAARPDPTTLTAATGWGAFVWIIVLAAVATRSTRWRS